MIFCILIDRCALEFDQDCSSNPQDFQSCRTDDTLESRASFG